MVVLEGTALKTIPSDFINSCFDATIFIACRLSEINNKKYFVFSFLRDVDWWKCPFFLKTRAFYMRKTGCQFSLFRQENC
jgi:hypothetical protein